MVIISALPPLPEDWVSTLALKRQQGRRMLPEIPPPYLTADGWVLVDRRSHQDRRKALGSAASCDANHPDDPLSPSAVVHSSPPR